MRLTFPRARYNGVMGAVFLSNILPDQPEALHHAYCLIGPREPLRALLDEFLQNVLGVALVGNPDCLSLERETFGIEESRYLAEAGSRKAFNGSRKVFIIAADFFTTEAQNALLKTLEEPRRDTHFFLITESEKRLISTLRSRCLIIHAPSVGEKDRLHRDARPFLAHSLPQRLTTVKRLLKTPAEGTPNKQVLLSFLAALEQALMDGTTRPYPPHIAGGLEELERCRNYLEDRGSSPRLILEHLSLVLPRVS